MPDRQRLDAALVERGLAGGREKAKELIAAGVVTINGTAAKKASQPVEADDVLACTATLHSYVGRGGDKLEKVLDKTALSPQGCCCLDIGASTGGFTDCLLRRGAVRVYALDVGHGQLHPTLCADSRVVNLEGTDVRRVEDVLSHLGGDRPDIITIDVSFISLMKIWPAVETLAAPEAAVVTLIKPQFEAGRSALGKKGVVKDSAAHRDVLIRLIHFWQDAGWIPTHLDYSPITGGEGNIEYLAVLRRAGATGAAAWPGDVRRLVEEARRILAGKGGQRR